VVQIPPPLFFQKRGKMKQHAVLVLKHKDKILFVKRSMKKSTLPGIWAFPSGTTEKGEEVYDTIKREALEELNVEVKTEKIFAEILLPEFSVRLIFVLCTIKSGNPTIKEPNEIDRFEWMSFPEFFERFSDNEIGHGLIWLRKNPEIWKSI